MQKVTYIIPIHEFSYDYMKKALMSVNNPENVDNYYVMLAGQKEILDQYKPLFDEIGLQKELMLFETEETDLFKKINDAVVKCVTPYFSVLEFDDEFYPYWDKVAQEYLDEKRYTILMPVIENQKEDGTVVSLGNEIALDAAFTNDIGVLTLDELKVFKDFQTSGSYIKTDDFLRVGGLKSELKIVAWYEFLLNIAKQEDTTIYVAPRIGYKHTILRDGSYLSETIKTLTQEEGQQLIAQALDNYIEKETTENGDE